MRSAPNAQAWARDHKVGGDLTATGRGVFRLDRLDDSRAEAAVALEKARVSVGENTWPADRVRVDATYDGGSVNGHVTAELLGGQITSEFAVGLGERPTVTATWTAAGVRLEHALGVVREGEPEYAGIISGQGNVRSRGNDWRETIAGEGNVAIREGRLMKLPVVRDLLNAFQSAEARLGLTPRNRDQADIQFELTPTAMRIVSGNITAGMFAFQGTGLVYYDQRLDLTVTPALLERSSIV